MNITDSSLIIIIPLMVIGGIFIGVIATLIHQSGRKLLPEERSQRILIGIALIAIAASTVDSRDDITISATDRAVITALREPDHLITINLADCPPQSEGSTDQLIMTITSRSDTQPEVTGCARIAQRQYTANNQ
jgi:flagellar basal body-associated protein FliL